MTALAILAVFVLGCAGAAMWFVGGLLDQRVSEMEEPNPREVEALRRILDQTPALAEAVRRRRRPE